MLSTDEVKKYFCSEETHSLSNMMLVSLETLSVEVTHPSLYQSIKVEESQTMNFQDKKNLH